MMEAGAHREEARVEVEGVHGIAHPCPAHDHHRAAQHACRPTASQHTQGGLGARRRQGQ